MLILQGPKARASTALALQGPKARGSETKPSEVRAGGLRPPIPR